MQIETIIIAMTCVLSDPEWENHVDITFLNPQTGSLSYIRVPFEVALDMKINDKYSLILTKIE